MLRISLTLTLVTLLQQRNWSGILTTALWWNGKQSLLTTSLQYLARMWELFTCRYPMLDWPCSIVFLRSVYSHMASSIKPDLTTYPGSKNCHWFFFLPKLYLKSNSWSNPSYFSRAGQKLWNYSSLQLAHLTTMGSFVLSPCSLLSCTPSS